MLMREKAYFWLACYFRFFARLVLSSWKPRIIVITGSGGKSTALALFYELLQKKFSVKKSVKANSAIGVPLDILDIHFINYTAKEWLRALFFTPFRAVKYILSPPKTKIYLVELDADRPGEMSFFANFIKPEIVFWVSSYATHTASFDQLVKKGLFTTSVDAVAAEFAKIINALDKKGLALVNGDSPAIKKALRHKKINKIEIKDKKGRYSFSKWKIYRKRTRFKLNIAGTSYEIFVPYIFPKNLGYTLVAFFVVAKHFAIDDKEVMNVLEEFKQLPGRVNIFKGIHNSTLIDSTYNSNLEAACDLLLVLNKYPGKRKIAVLGDMRELGELSKSQHETLAQEIIKKNPEVVVLVGPQMKQYCYPRLSEKGYDEARLYHFDNTYQAGIFIKERLVRPGDTILLKASQNTLFFEIIVEMLLADKADVVRLCRREAHWEEKRDAVKQQFFQSLSG